MAQQSGIFVFFLATQIRGSTCSVHSPPRTPRFQHMPWAYPGTLMHGTISQIEWHLHPVDEATTYEGRGIDTCSCFDAGRR